MRQIQFVGRCFMLYLIAINAGCGGESLVRVPSDDTEFSTPADYADYDHEMRALTAGQTDWLNNQNPQPENAETSP